LHALKNFSQDFFGLAEMVPVMGIVSAHADHPMCLLPIVTVDIRRTKETLKSTRATETKLWKSHIQTTPRSKHLNKDQL